MGSHNLNPTTVSKPTTWSSLRNLPNPGTTLSFDSLAYMRDPHMQEVAPISESQHNRYSALHQAISCYVAGQRDQSNAASSTDQLGLTLMDPCTLLRYADWQCAAACFCPFNMFLAPLWLHKMANYVDKQCHVVKKNLTSFERRGQTEVLLHSDNIPGLGQDIMNLFTGGLTGTWITSRQTAGQQLRFFQQDFRRIVYHFSSAQRPSRAPVRNTAA